MKKYLSFLFLLTLFIPLFINAQEAPTCNISFTPQTIEVGQSVKVTFKTTGIIEVYNGRGIGDISYRLFSGDDYDSFLSILKTTGIYSNRIKTSQIGISTQKATVEGPGGSNTCTGSYTVIPKSTLKNSGDFQVQEQDIEPFQAKGILKIPAAFRNCPSTNCSIIKYYAETSQVNIIGKYKKDNWYQIDGSTDAKGGNGKKIIGWINGSVFDKTSLISTIISPSSKDIDKNITDNNRSENKNFLGKIILINNKIIYLLIALFSILIISMLYRFLKRKNIIKIDFSKIEIPNIKRKWVFTTLIIFAGAVVVTGLVFATNKYQSNIKAKEKQTADLIAKQQEDLITSQKEKEDLVTKQQEDLNNINNKITELENKKPQIIYKTIEDTTPKERTTNEITKEWSPQVAYVYCEWNYSNGTLYAAGSGSGFLTIYKDGSINVMTNKHVILDRDKYTPTFCSVSFLNGEKYTTQWDNKNFGISENYDIASITLSGLSYYLTNLTKRGGFYCSNEPEIGDKVVVLGYPGIGSSKGITVTEGIISGIESYYYVTSAKIDHGNSGGIAVSVKNDCIIGIPSASVAGSIESLGRILSSKAILGN